MARRRDQPTTDQPDNAMASTRPTPAARGIVESGAANDRAGLVLVMRALREGWDIPRDVLSELPAVVVEMARTANSSRDRLRAIETLLAMQRANHDALVAADRCERLDGGMATERVELGPMTLRPGGGAGG